MDLNNTNEDVSTAERQRDQVQAENEDLKKHVGELRQQLQTLQQQIDELVSVNNRQQQYMSLLNEDVATLQAENKELRETLVFCIETASKAPAPKRLRTVT